MTDRVARLDAVANAFRLGVKTFSRDGSPLTAALCASGQYDPDIVKLAANAKAGSPPHFHLFCAVHALLLQRSEEPLARFYATLTAETENPSGAWPYFRDFCLEHRSDLLAILQSRNIQTSTPRRAGYILPLLEHVATAVGEPLNLIEIGTSAGFLLAFDGYRFEYGDLGVAGDPHSRVVVQSEIRGTPRTLPRVPQIGRRVGLDLDPIIDPSGPDREWLIALMMPEWRQEALSLDDAFDIIRDKGIEFVAGDALQALPALLDSIADPLCVFHSACLYYWPAPAKQALETLLIEKSRGRTVYRLSVETPDDYATRAARQASGEMPPDDNPIFPVATITRYQDGQVHADIVARCGRFGEWIEWISTNRR